MSADAVPGENATARARPNIVYILADQHRADVLGCAGHPTVLTPNLDQLASEGTRFTQAWCQSPVCQPARASLVTGLHVTGHGISRNFVSDFDPSWDTLMRRLRAAGYTTANVGKTHYYSPRRQAQGEASPGRTVDLADEHGPFIESFGFDYVLEEFDRYVHAVKAVRTPYTAFLDEAGLLDPYREAVRSVFRLTPRHWDGIVSPIPKQYDLTTFLTDAAINWVDTRRGDDQPFFLQLSYVQPHVPLMGDPEWSEYYSHRDVPARIGREIEPKSPQWAKYLTRLRQHSNSPLLSDEYVARGARQYYAMVSLIDESIGRLLSALARNGKLDDTWIIYSSDHGEMMGDHNLMAKMNFYAQSARIPALLRPPARFRRSTPVAATSTSLVEAVDISATVLDIAGLGAQFGDGRSLLPLMTGAGAEVRSYLVSEISADLDGERSFLAVSDGKHRATVERTTRELCEAFDLDQDAQELDNRAGQEDSLRIFSLLEGGFAGEGFEVKPEALS